MQDLDYDYLCNVIANLAGIPLRLYECGELKVYHSLVRLPKDPLIIYKDEVFAVKANVGYFITPFFDYYGIVNSGERKIILGPSRQVAMSDQEIRELAFKCDVLQDDVEEFLSGIKSIVRMPLESIMQILFTMNYIMNGEKLNLGDIAIYQSFQQELKTKLEAEQTIRNYYKDVQSTEFTPHNTLALEQTVMNIIRKGDTASLSEWLASAPAVTAGVLAADQLRQLKNTFIVTATLAARAAIRGGMDVDDSLSLSDSYIQHCELLVDVESIVNLQYHMILEYTKRVEKLRYGKSPSKLVTDVANFIQHHISEAITTKNIADALFMSRSRLSTKFKAECGENLVEFILKEKTEEAKRLLRYTDKQSVAISNYLGFSSQSHFSRVFKKYTGSTPNEYREKHSL